jgi:hypothetical protein
LDRGLELERSTGKVNSAQFFNRRQLEDTMKFQPNKQLALKAALLMVLAANVSFEPLKTTMSETLSSEVKSTTTVEQNADKVTNTETVVTKPLKASTAYRAEDCKAKPTGKNLKQVGDVERLRFCGKHMESITYYTETVDGESHTHIKIASLDNKGIVDAHVSMCLPYSDTTRATLLTEAKKNAHHRLCEEETAAPAETTASTSTTPAAKPKPSTTAENDEPSNDGGSVEELERAVKNCEMKKTRITGAWEYKEIRGREQITCNIRRLRSLEKTMRVDLGRKPTKEELADAAREIITDDVKHEIRDLARSSDPEDNSEARELADNLGDALDSFVDRYNIRDRELKKTVKAMKGYKSLAHVSETTHEYDESLDTLREKTIRAQANYDRTHNIAYLQQLNQLKAQGFNLSNQFEFNMLKNDPFMQVESNNWLSSAEVSPFRSMLDSVTSEYSTFWNYLMGMGTLSGSQDRQSIVQTLPSNAFDYRNSALGQRSSSFANGLPTTIPRFNTVTTSTYPSAYPTTNPTTSNPFAANNTTSNPFATVPRTGGVTGPFGY